MSFTNETQNYHLPQWVGSDKPTWLVDLNDAFSDIDTGMAATQSQADATDGVVAGHTSAITALQNTTSDQGAAITGLRTDVDHNIGDISTINSLIGNGVPTTTDRTIIGAINELNTMTSYATPEKYGAKGDGTTDDTVAIQAAVTNNAVVVLKSLYKITNTITLPRNHVIIGTDKELYGLTTTDDIVMISADNEGYWAVKDILLTKSTNNHFHIEAAGSLFVIDNCVLKNTTSSGYEVGGIKVSAATPATGNYCGKITGNRLQDSNIEISGHTDGYIMDNIIWTAPNTTLERYAIKLIANSWQISNNQIVPGALGGVYFERASGATGQSDIHITDNYFDGSDDELETGTFIIVKNAGCPFIISGNKFWHGYKNSIKLINSQHVQIVNNSFSINNRSRTESYEIEYDTNQYGNRLLIADNTFENNDSQLIAYLPISPHAVDIVEFLDNVITGQGFVALKDAYCFVDTVGVISENNQVMGRYFKKIIGIVQALDATNYGITAPKLNNSFGVDAVRISGADSTDYTFTLLYDVYKIYRAANTDEYRSIAVICHYD